MTLYITAAFIVGILGGIPTGACLMLFWPKREGE